MKKTGKTKTKIKQKKPLKKEERVSVGIENFDSLIEGGFEKNSTNQYDVKLIYI